MFTTCLLSSTVLKVMSVLVSTSVLCSRDQPKSLNGCRSQSLGLVLSIPHLCDPDFSANSTRSHRVQMVLSLDGSVVEPLF